MAFTIYLTPPHNSFNKYEAISNGPCHVTVANVYRIPVIGVNTVRLRMKITGLSKKVLIKNVVLSRGLHAPQNKESSIPVPCLTERDLKFKFNNVDAVIIGKHGIERTAKRFDRIYIIDQDDDSEQVHVVTTGDIHLRNRQLGYADHDKIPVLHKATIGMPNIKRFKWKGA